MPHIKYCEVGTLAVDGLTVTFGTARRGLTVNISETVLYRDIEAGQGIDLDPERTHLHEQRWRGIQLTDSL